MPGHVAQSWDGNTLSVTFRPGFTISRTLAQLRSIYQAQTGTHAQKLEATRRIIVQYLRNNGGLQYVRGARISMTTGGNLTEMIVSEDPADEVLD